MKNFNGIKSFGPFASFLEGPVFQLKKNFFYLSLLTNHQFGTALRKQECLKDCCASCIPSILKTININTLEIYVQLSNKDCLIPDSTIKFSHIFQSVANRGIPTSRPTQDAVVH